MAKTKIEWVEYSINPIRAGKGKSWPSGTHCTKVSPGCAHCFAEPLNKRFGNGLPYDNTPTEFHLDLSVFDTLPKTKPVKVFVQSMGDLFHEDVPFEFIEEVYEAIEKTPRHKFLILTKRPDRMLEWFKDYTNNFCDEWAYSPNLWLGVTAENQEMADKRIPILLQIPAAKRFVSIEPMLGGVDLMTIPDGGWPQTDALHGTTGSDCQIDVSPKLNHVIVGAESGHKRRECEIEWVRNIVEQCKDAGVPCFVKQIHINGKVSKNMAEWPEDLRVQEYPQGVKT